MEPVRAVCPVGRLRVFCTIGTNITSPKNPNTTEGMPARTSIKGFSKSATFGFATSAIYIAQAIPRGTAKIIEPAVTRREPKNRGNSPNSLFTDSGYHNFPVRKSRRDVFLKRSKLSLNKKRHMRKTITTVRALTENSPNSIIFSLYFLLNILSPENLYFYFFCGINYFTYNVLPFFALTKLKNQQLIPVHFSLVQFSIKGEGDIKISHI
jgi:hypothetical protein